MCINARIVPADHPIVFLKKNHMSKINRMIINEALLRVQVDTHVTRLGSIPAARILRRYSIASAAVPSDFLAQTLIIVLKLTASCGCSLPSPVCPAQMPKLLQSAEPPLPGGKGKRKNEGEGGRPNHM